MVNTIVKDSHLTFNGVAFFRGHSEEMLIGSIGEKRTPLSKQNYLEVKDRVPVDKIKIMKSTVVEIDTTKLKKTDVSTKISAIVPISGVPVPITLGVDAAFEKLKSAELKLVKFSVLANHMVRAVNDSPQKRRFLIDWGDDARIVHEAFFAMDAKTATKFDNNVDVNIAAGVDKVIKATVGIGGSGSGETTVEISEGTCFAYLLGRFVWDAKQKKNITKALDMNDDQWSFS